MSKLTSNGFANEKAKTESIHFQFLENVEEITEILRSRLPKSANVYNMSRFYPDFKKPEEMGFYVMCINNEDKMTGSGTWVLVKFSREIYGMGYAVSAPGNPEITPEITKAFAECPFINWNEAYHFSCIDSAISPMIWEISTQHFGNSVFTMPCKAFVINQELAAKIQVAVPQEFELKSLSTDVGKGTKFICQTWKHYVPGKTDEAIQKLLEKNSKSVGLYRNGEIICGLCTNDAGLMGYLHTVKEHRGKGYATLVMRQLMKNLAVEKGAHPSSVVEVRNQQSIAFHEKMGLTFSHYVDYIKYVPQTWS